MRYSAWQSLKQSWPTMLSWQRAFVVLAFPLIFAWLTVVAWGVNRNGHDNSETSGQA